MEISFDWHSIRKSISNLNRLKLIVSYYIIFAKWRIIMLIETLGKVRELYQKVREQYNQEKSLALEAEDEIFEIFTSILIDNDKKEELLLWLRENGSEDKTFTSFVKKSILMVNNNMYQPNESTVEDLYANLDLAVQDDESGGETTGYEDLMECMENFVDARDFEALQNMFQELCDRVESQSNFNYDYACFDIFLEVLYYVLSNIFKPVGDNKISSSTLYSLPIILRGKNGVIATPDLNVLEDTIRNALENRGCITDRNSINIGTVISNSVEVKKMGFEDFWNLHNNILFDYSVGKDNNLRQDIQKHNGDSSLIYCFLTVNLVGIDDDVEGRVNILDMISAAFKDRQLWLDIGESMENHDTEFVIFQPEDWVNSINKLELMRELTRFGVLFGRQSKGSDVIYADYKDSEDIALMFTSREDGLLTMGYKLEVSGERQVILLELERLAKRYDVLLYKYKHKLKFGEFDKLEELAEKDSSVDISKYLEHSVLVDSEWRGWLTPGYLTAPALLQ